MRTPHESYKDRFKCHKCNWSGDACDIIRHFNRYANYPEQLHILGQLEKERIAIDSSFPKGGTKRRTLQDDHQVAVGLIWADYRDNDGFKLPLQLAERCKAAGITVEDVIQYERSIRDWLAESDQRHLDECDDPECDACVCRNARGLSPLTPEEIEQDRRELELAVMEQQARIDKALKRVRRM